MCRFLLLLFVYLRNICRASTRGGAAGHKDEREGRPAFGSASMERGGLVDVEYIIQATLKAWTAEGEGTCQAPVFKREHCGHSCLHVLLMTCSSPCSRKQGARLDGKSCFYVLFRGLPGKAEERTRKHRLSSPGLLLSLSRPWEMVSKTHHPETSLGCLDCRMGSSVFQGLVCVNVYTNYVRVRGHSWKPRTLPGWLLPSLTRTH